MKKIFLIPTLFISIVCFSQQYKNYGNDHKHFINSQLDSINSGAGTTVVYGSGTSPVLKGTNASSGVGVFGESSSGYAIQGNSTTGTAGLFTINPSSTNANATLLQLTRNTSGTGANNIAGSIDYYVEDASSTALAIQAIAGWLNATHASRSAFFTISGVKNTSQSDWFKLDGDFGYLATDTISTRAYARSVGGGGGGGPVALSSLTAMAGSNTIDNVDYPNTWNWNSLATTGTGTAFTLGASSTATISNSILKINRTGASTGAINTIGLDIVNSATGASATNMGLRISSSGASINYGLIVAAGQVGIGNQTPAASSIVDIVSTTQGFLAPRMTTTQQNAISSPATGLLIYNTDSSSTHPFMFYNGSAWVNVGDGGSGGGGGGMADPGGNGIVVRTALNTTINRTLQGTTNEISVANGSGVSADPTISLPSTLALNSKTVGVNSLDFTQIAAPAAPGSGISRMYFNSTTGVLQYKDNASNVFTVINNIDAQTLDNKRINPRIGSTASSSTPTPNADSHDVYEVTALAVGATFGAPTGTPVDGQPLLIRIKDNGTARTLAFNSGTGGYRASTDLPLPTITTLSKTMYLKFIYNSADSKWDFVSFLDNFSLLDGFIFSIILGGLATGLERRIRRRMAA